MKYAKDLTGRQFGRWLVLKRAPNKNGEVYWTCQCQCEKKTIRNVNAKRLKDGTSKSCGCYSLQCIKEYNKLQRNKNNYKIVNDYVVFYLSHDKTFTIDLSDLDFVLNIKRCWFLNKQNYVTCKYKGKEVKLHNYIMKPQNGYMVDHIDGDSTNNRRYNLRICKEIDNAKNKKTPTNNTSGVKGVTWNNIKNAWQVRIGYNNKRICLGYYTDFDKATKVRKAAEKKYFKEFANDR